MLPFTSIRMGKAYKQQSHRFSDHITLHQYLFTQRNLQFNGVDVASFPTIKENHDFILNYVAPDHNLNENFMKVFYWSIIMENL